MTPAVVKTIFLVLVTLAALFEGAGDVLLKKWAVDGRSIFFMVGVAVYIVATIVWAYTLKYEFLSKAISVVSIINLIVVILVGVLYFKEDLSTINKIGILLGIISIVLIEAK